MGAPWRHGCGPEMRSLSFAGKTGCRPPLGPQALGRDLAFPPTAARPSALPRTPALLVPFLRRLLSAPHATIKGAMGPGGGPSRWPSLPGEVGRHRQHSHPRHLALVSSLPVLEEGRQCW